MTIEDLNQISNRPKSEPLFEEHQEKEKESQKKKGSIIDKIIFVICGSVVFYVGITFINCNFMLPGSIQRANSLGGLKNPPPLDCKESESRGYNALFTVLGYVLGIKAKVDD